MHIRSNNDYDVFVINNNSNKKRLIQKPSKQLKEKQKKLIPLYSQFPLHKACSCAKGLGPAVAAAPHIGARYLLKVDISNCYENITLEKVYRAITDGQIDDLLKEKMITNLPTCFIGWKGKQLLPTGSPTSPILCNIALSSIDTPASQIAEKYGYAYTRYMDDLNFSTTKKDRDWDLIDKIKKLLISEGYPVNYKKTKWYGKGDNDAKIVAGINLETISRREIKRKIRAQLNKIAKNNELIDQTTNGYLAYINSIDKTTYNKLMNYLAKRREFFHPESTQ